MRINKTEINEHIVFIFTLFKRNRIIQLIIKLITNVGIIGSKPQPYMIINIIIKNKLTYIVKKVFKPRLPPISIKRSNNIRDNSFIII